MRTPYRHKRSLPYPPPEKKFLTREEAAAYISRGKSTLEQLHQRGTGPKFYKVARSVLYLREDLDAWILSHGVDPVPKRPPGRPRKKPVEAEAATVMVGRRTGVRL